MKVLSINERVIFIEKDIEEQKKHFPINSREIFINLNHRRKETVFSN